MATKGKGKILEGQIAFEFMGVMETEIKPKKKRESVKKEIKTIKKPKAIKFNHIKRNRKIKKVNCYGKY